MHVRSQPAIRYIPNQAARDAFHTIRRPCDGVVQDSRSQCGSGEQGDAQDSQAGFTRKPAVEPAGRSWFYSCVWQGVVLHFHAPMLPLQSDGNRCSCLNDEGVQFSLKGIVLLDERPRSVAGGWPAGHRNERIGQVRDARCGHLSVWQTKQFHS